MKRFTRLAMGASSIVGLLAFAAPIAAGALGTTHGPDFGDAHPVFVQTDNVAGNQVVAYDRAADGSLTLANTYSTGGLGGVLNGSHVDHLGSQGSLTYDASHSLLYAVNAGSNTVSVFSVRGDQLILRQVVSSGGTFPVSVAVHGDLVSVLNAQAGGSIQEFYSFFGRLIPVPGSNRNLGLTIPTDGTQFTHTPGQVLYSPDGSQLIVTTKATTNAIEAFRVGFLGFLSQSPMVTTESGSVPFAPRSTEPVIWWWENRGPVRSRRLVSITTAPSRRLAISRAGKLDCVGSPLLDPCSTRATRLPTRPVVT